MKKILVLLFITLSPFLLSAQWSVGGKAGVAFSNYKTKTPWKEVSNMGFAFGAVAFKQVKNNLGLSFELHYIQKGYFHKICNDISDELQANYLEVPAMVDYSFIIPSLKNFKMHGTLGVYTAYWLSGKYKMKGFDQENEDFDFKKSKASRFDFGPNAGARVEYILNNGSLSLDFRYEIGLMDLQKRVNDNTRNTNKTAIVGISYMKLL